MAIWKGVAGVSALAVAGVLVAEAAGWISLGLFDNEPAVEAVAPEPDPSARTGTPENPVAVPGAVTATPEPDAAPDTDAEQASALAPPVLTDVRIEPDGLALLSGRAEPATELAILLDGVEVDRVTTDATGAFLAFPALGPAGFPRRIELVLDPDGAAVFANESLVVAPTERRALAAASPDAAPEVAPRPVAEPAAAEPVTVPAAEATSDRPAAPGEEAPASEPDTAAMPDANLPGPAPATAAEPEPTPPPTDAVADLAAEEPASPDSAVATEPGAASGTPQADAAAVDAAPGASDEDPARIAAGAAVEAAAEAAPPVLALDAEGVRVVQPAAPSDTAPEVLDTIALDAITYDPSGAVELTGRAGEGQFVNIYVDNQPVATRPVGPSGDWRSDLPEVDRGVYTLRIDEVTADGAVVSRIETPFRREAPEAVAGLAAELEAQGRDIAVTTVQPGNTLWAISEERYGRGILYVEVFAANADRIRDPDLIYPGQVFVLPELDLFEAD